MPRTVENDDKPPFDTSKPRILSRVRMSGGFRSQLGLLVDDTPADLRILVHCTMADAGFSRLEKRLENLPILDECLDRVDMLARIVSCAAFCQALGDIDETIGRVFETR